MSDTEFENMRAVVEKAADLLDPICAPNGKHRFDYLIAVVPVGEKAAGDFRNISMMASVPAHHLGSFIEYINQQYAVSAARGRVIDTTPGEGKPS